MEEVFRDEDISYSFFNLTRANIDRDDLSHLHIEKLMNVRCRGLTISQIENVFLKTTQKSSRFFLFVRHPASFFKSAARYNSRGSEKWTRKKKLIHLGGKTLFEALNCSEDLEDKLIVSMIHFGIVRQLVNTWVEVQQRFYDEGRFLRVIRVEDIWGENSEEELKTLSADMSHDGFEITTKQLLSAAPLQRETPKSHSTGTYLENPYDGYTGAAREMYDRYFRKLEATLGYCQYPIT